MKNEFLKIPYNLQFFAEGEGNGSDDPDHAGEGGDAGTNGEGEGNEGKGTEGTGSSEKTFTQKQVSSMMAKEKKQGRDAAYREMGIDPNDTKMVNMFKAFVDSQKTEEEKQQQQNAENATKIAEAEHRAQVAEAKAEAMKAGAKPEFVDDIVALAMTKVDDNTDINSVIGDLKTKYAIWFGVEESDEGKETGKKGTGSSVGGSGTGSGKGGEQNLGQRLAASRQQSNAGGKERKSFWS